MERHSLTKKEYAELQEIAASKRAVKEMVQALNQQMTSSIIKEDAWWQKMAKKFELDTTNNVHSISHATQEIVGITRPQRNTPEPTAQPQLVPATQAQQQPQPGISKRERSPEMDKMISADELEAMRKQREEI